MPDLVKYSEVTPTQTSDVNNNALVSMSNVVNNEYVSGVVTMTTLGAKLNNNIEYATALQTTNKTIVGAINEVAQGGGGGGSSTLAGLTDVTLTTPTDGQALIYDSATSKWVNGASGGGNANIWEGTQAEYDAIVNKDPDTVYFITDTNGDGSQFQPVIYSENEREIGVWTDGKPLYEKTINFGALPDNSIKDVAHNISDVEHIWIVGGFAENPTNRFTNQLNLSGTGSISGQWYTGVNETSIRLVTNSNRADYTICYVTLRYTKTTDQPGSGQWTPQGVPAIHYSATEQVVGTWIDGKTLYEKTVVIPSGTLRAGDNITDISGLGVDIVVGQPSACIVFDNGASMRTIPFAISGNYGVEIFADKSRIVIVRKIGDLDYNNIFVTLRYTKAST